MAWLTNEQRNPEVGLIGDDPTMLYLIADVLMADGFDVIGVYRPDKVKELTKSRTLDLVVYDETGVGRRGEQVLDFTRHCCVWSGLPVILLTDQECPNYLGRCLDEGMEDVLTKPFRVHEFQARARKAIRHGRIARIEDSGEVMLEGCLVHMGLPDLLFHLHQGRATGMLEVGEGRRTYVFLLKEGELVEAQGPLPIRGRKALFRALRCARGRFRFTSACIAGRIDTELSALPQLVLTGIQESDEYGEARKMLPPGPLLVSLDRLEELEGLEELPSVLAPIIACDTCGSVDELIEHCELTDLEAVRSLIDLFKYEVLFAADSEYDTAH